MKVGVEISPLSTGSISQASVVNDVFLLLDVSGSMKGEKFNALKLSTKKIVQSLPAFTRLYMCAYGSPGCVAEFDLTSINEDDRQRAMKFIDGLSLAGFTNMGSALRTVIQIVKNRSDNNPATVTALTDGKPDSKPECITAVNQAMDDLGKKVPLSFHTIGFGLADSEGELDGAFLHKMAELGRGRYYYAAGLNLEDVMGEILRDSVNVQAQQVKLRMRASQGVSVLTTFPSQATAEDGSNQLFLKDISSYNELAFVSLGGLQNLPEGEKQTVLELELEYVNPISQKAETLSSALRINHDGTHASVENDAESPEREALCQIETKVLFKQGQGEAAQQQASMCKSEGLKSEAEKMKTLSNEQMFSRFSIIDKVNLGEGNQGFHRGMAIVVPRHSVYPVSRSITRQTFADDQTAISIELYEGEDEDLLDRNRLLGNFTLTGIPPLPRGQVDVKITFTIDADGILSVTGASNQADVSKTLKLDVSASDGRFTSQCITNLKSGLKNFLV